MCLCRSNSVEPQDRAGTVIGSPVCPVRHVLFVLCPHYAPHVCASLSECVRDSSTMITSRCENALWDNQYVWIWSELHTHTHTHKHTHWPPGWGVCLCLSLTHLWRTPPCSVPYKTAAVGAARRGLLTSTRGDVTVSLGKTDRTGTITTSVTAGHCKPPRATSKQAWLPLRNPWRWCPSSRGNASVSHVWF